MNTLIHLSDAFFGFTFILMAFMLYVIYLMHHTIKTLKTKLEVVEENYTLDLESLNNRVDELYEEHTEYIHESRFTELETRFEELYDGLDSKQSELADELSEIWNHYNELESVVNTPSAPTKKKTIIKG